ncbi:helix-turn-helix domain-containing protein [Longispora sp. NPDC051575]|uniref:TetR/AcrR family transcriptional regulator n=1 Tax=Longispora sp. NPDC051575 TaxID=3154943 RepID=UPI003424160C
MTSPSGRRPGPRPRISREDAAVAALELGFRDLTLTAVADRLGVNHSSLYRHIRGREDLVLAAIDLAVARVEWPVAGEDWRGYLTDVAEAIWRLFETNPGLAEEVRVLAVSPPAVTEVFFAVVTELVRLGFTGEDAVLAMDTVADLAADSYRGWDRLTQVRHTPDGPTSVRDTMREAWGVDRTDRASAPFARIMTAIIDGSAHDWWRRKLDLVLEGLAARAPSAGG